MLGKYARGNDADNEKHYMRGGFLLGGAIGTALGGAAGFAGVHAGLKRI